MPHSRENLQELARIRIAEAIVLTAAGCASGGYYLAGYAIECALKAKIAARFRENEIPDKALINSIYTHDLIALLRLSNLIWKMPLKLMSNLVGVGQLSRNGPSKHGMKFGRMIRRPV